MLHFAASNSTTIARIGKSARTNSPPPSSFVLKSPRISSSALFSHQLASTIIPLRYTIKAAMSTVKFSPDFPSVKKQVFISVSDKTDLAFLGNELQSLGYTIVSTGETASALENVGVSVTKVELQLASFLEMASLSKRYHLPGTFEIVVANLYENVTSDGKAKFSGPMEDYDVEGISIISAAAKCYKDVLVVVDPRDYVALVDYLRGGGQNDILFGQRLAAKAFKHSSDYDSAVAEWMEQTNDFAVSNKK